MQFTIRGTTSIKKTITSKFNLSLTETYFEKLIEILSYEMNLNCIVLQFPASGATSIKNLSAEIFYQNIKFKTKKAYSEDVSEIRFGEANLICVVIQFSIGRIKNPITWIFLSNVKLTMTEGPADWSGICSREASFICVVKAVSHQGR